MSRDLGRRPIELDLHGQRQNSIKTPYRMIAARLVSLWTAFVQEAVSALRHAPIH